MAATGNTLFDVPDTWGAQARPKSELEQTVDAVVKDLEDRDKMTPVLRVQAATARRLAQIAGHEKSAIAAVNASAQLQTLIVSMDEQARGTDVSSLPPEVLALMQAFEVPGGKAE